MRRLALLGLIWVAVVWGAPPTISIPKETKGEPGEFVRIDSTTDGKVVRWFSLDRGLSVFPSELLRDSKTTVVVAVKPGSYRIAAITCLADELSELAIGYVVIGTPEPPTPPQPPSPPLPTDPLAESIQRLYGADTDAKKADYAKALAGFYRQSSIATTSTTVQTAGQLYDLLKRAAAGLIPETALMPIRQRVSAELQAILPTDADAKLTEKHRADASALFSRLATILGGLQR